MNGQKIVYQEREFNSIAELAAYTGVNKLTLRTRLRNGMPVEEAAKNKDFRCRPVVFHGKEYTSIQELCEEAGCSADIVKNRLERGFTMERAVTQEVSVTRQGKSGVYNGIPYKSIKALSEKVGVSESKMRRMIKVQNGVQE